MNDFFIALLLVSMGFVASLIWLWFYLRQDIHPEPRVLIIRTFLMGIVLAPWAVLGQLVIRPETVATTGFESISFIFGAAFIEELIKFLVVKYIVLHDPNFDEPVDAMIYMIVAGLGFAAIENILVLFRSYHDQSIIAYHIWGLRFVGATLLHALSSAVIGYFLALGWFFRRHYYPLLTVGLLLGTLIHFVFNMLLVSLNGSSALVYSTVGLIGVMILVGLLFYMLRQRRGSYNIGAYERLSTHTVGGTIENSV